MTVAGGDPQGESARGRGEGEECWEILRILVRILSSNHSTGSHCVPYPLPVSISIIVI